jgi:hypothetical protein
MYIELQPSLDTEPPSHFQEAIFFLGYPHVNLRSELVCDFPGYFRGPELKNMSNEPGR